jgi:acyl-homoserine-lactone acylase
LAIQLVAQAGPPRVWSAAASAVIGVLVITGCGGGSDPVPVAPQPEYKAQIRWTPYGVAHVKADDYAGLGYGAAYAQIRHRECELFDRTLATSGRRALIDGPGTNEANVNNDVYYTFLRTKVQGWLDGPVESIDTPSKNARDLMRGWAAGINRYLKEIGGADGITDPRCKGKAYIRPITELDAWMHVATYNGLAQTNNQVGIATAIPPGAVFPTTCSAPAAARSETAARGAPPLAADDIPDVSGDSGSNAYAAGRLSTKNGRGALLANPHWNWSGSQRYFNIHLIIPGEMDVMGVARDTMPFIIFGHNQNVAWNRTVSTSSRLGYWGLTLNPQDPTSYMYEGQYREMSSTCFSVDVLQADGTVAKSHRLIYETVWGPVVRTANFPWTAQKAYAFRTAIADLSGVKVLDEHIGFMKSTDVKDMANVLNKYGSVSGYQMAADSNGDMFVGDIGGVPGVTAAQVSGTTGAGCLDVDRGAASWANGIPVFDGSRAACAWQGDPGAPSGIAGLATAPHVFRQDYISQSNQSYWLFNPKFRLEGFPRIFGTERTNPGLRAQMGFKMAEERMAGTDGLPGKGFDRETFKSIMYSNRLLSSELARDGLVSRCEQANYAWNGVDLRLACDTLRTWDLRYNASSRGAAIWRQFRANGGLVFDVPFDPNLPFTTPNTLSATSPAVMNALATAVTQLQAANISLDAKLGDIQGLTRQGEYIPFHGGGAADGTYNVVPLTALQNTAGYPINQSGSGITFVMAVEFTDDGPKADTILPYSQSERADSPHHKDQTKLYSTYGWVPHYFKEAEINAVLVKQEDIREPIPNP